MTEAAEAAGVRTQVGFNYLCNPMLRLAREMIAAGELGEVWSYRGVHAEDYMADLGAPWGFRHDPAGGGALADIGSHALATAEFLLGPIARVMGDAVRVIAERPDGRGGRRAVAVDDVARALVRFEGGASGSIEAGPEHPPYGRFTPAPGHQLGFNDLKAIEMAGFLDAIVGRAPEPFPFRRGLRVRSLVEAIQASAREERWIGVG